MRTVLIPAAGIGSRFGKKKQFLMVNGKLLIEYAIAIFENSELIDSIVLILPREDVDRFSFLRKRFKKLIDIVPGGPDRQHSVLEGLERIRDLGTDEVIIHDGVRPFFSRNLIEDLTVAYNEYGVDGIITGVRPRETVKLASSEIEPGDFIVGKTVDRNRVILVQTPQLFNYDVLLKCHKKADEEEIVLTDDSALLERYGYSIVSIQGDYRNIKVTTPNDIEMIRPFLPSE